MPHIPSRKRAAQRPDWITGLAENGKARYLQIVDLIERAVADGKLSPGDRLPAQRKLAEMIGVDLTTVTRGFSEAHRRNLIESRGPLGTFISPPRATFMQRIDLSMNIPPPPADIDLAVLLRRGLSQVLVRSDVDLLMTYQLGGGSDSDREAGAAWLKPILGQVDRARVVVTPGAHSTLAALMLALTKQDEPIFTEQLIYPGLPLIARQLGRTLRPVACDADGMRPDALDAACNDARGGLIYLNPTVRNPTAQSMSEQRRKDVLAVAARRNIKIVEDDPYWLFAGDPPAPLASLAPQQVYYLSTLSKCISPGLRAAFLVLPSATGQDAFLRALRSLSLMSPPLTTSLVTQWILDGTASEVLTGVLKESAQRLLSARQILASASSSMSGGGIHVWQPLPEHWAAHGLAAAARSEGLVVAPSSAFCQSGDVPNAIRISLGGCTRRSELTAALRKLADLLQRKPDADDPLLV
ncbi:PLP-dependent aminotransferase family protein [Paraburkholderia sp. LEh10]|uniref:aminotransferase-like domain-containing protein n=1 Tax=Paraburkholderia sp. LEh10 TaxID=2821353 RepID=UPI001FD7EBA8|nr:PLP-dependent aminotransferase family protein [Paraburkholderia sp. LEh10]